MSEFDLTKNAYIEKHNDSLVLGLTHDDFRKQKTGWVRDFITKVKPHHLLDFGFGAGELLEDVSGLVPRISGVDPSAVLRLELANKLASKAHLVASIDEIENASIDLITCFNVLHHIPREARVHTSEQMMKKLKPGGTVLIWEHNPLNLGTQFVVCRCEYDHDAVLLMKSEVAKLFGKLECVSSEYVNVTPPSLHKKAFFSSVERWFKSVPVGAQYRSVFRKSR